MKNGSVLLDNIQYVTEDIYQLIKAYTISKNDLYITVAGTIGCVGEIPEELDKANLTENANKIVFSIIDKRFLMYALQSELVQSQIKACTTKVGQPKLAIKRIQRFLIALPPLNEQRRIVEALEDFIPHILKFEQAQIYLDKLNTNLSQKIRKSVLQEAIQGNLVPQDDSEESASILLQRIKDEKLRLVKEGKLNKKDVIGSTIYRGDDNKYYEQIDGQTIELDCETQFPQSWQLCRLSFICQLIDGTKTKGKRICLDAKYLRGKSAGTMIEQGRFVYKGDNIILVDGENSGEVFTVPVDGYMGSTFKQLWVSETMNLHYVLFVIRFYKEMLRNSKKGAAIPHLNKQLFYSIIVGIPPIEEQQRIVSKVNHLLQLSD